MAVSRLHLFRALLVLVLALHAGNAARAAEPAAGRDLTFFVVSDLHYNYPAKGDYRLPRAAIEQMNALPGKAYPRELGGKVEKPRGVLVLGDLVESPKDEAHADWEADFGLRGEKMLGFPVYELLGNHDSSGPRGWEMIKRRNGERQDLDGVSENGYHYSWTWDGIHFVALNLCADNGPDPSLEYKPDPRGALDFLVRDLEKNIGDSGKPVIILQHFDLRQDKWWSPARKEAFYQAIKDYRVICMMNGHTHTSMVQWWHGIPVLDDGAVKNGKQDPGIGMFFVVNIQGDRLTARQRMLKGNWGRVALDVDFSNGRPVAPPKATEAVGAGAR